MTDYTMEKITSSKETRGIDRVIVLEAGAVLWARFYELDTDRFTCAATVKCITSSPKLRTSALPAISTRVPDPPNCSKKNAPPGRSS